MHFYGSKEFRRIKWDRAVDSAADVLISVFGKTERQTKNPRPNRAGGEPRPLRAGAIVAPLRRLLERHGDDIGATALRPSREGETGPPLQGQSRRQLL